MCQELHDKITRTHAPHDRGHNNCRSEPCGRGYGRIDPAGQTIHQSRESVLSCGLMGTIPDLAIGVVSEPSVHGVAEETHQLGGGIFGARVTGEERQELHITLLYRC
jgi:hypothetical protein